MKKNFFKKLSFVMALAMIVTVLAPAAGVFAATATKLNQSTRYLYIGQDGKDEFDFNVVGTQSGWKYNYTSSNKNVATVDAKSGVAVAVGKGKATITCVISDKKGVVKKLPATVYVRDNINAITGVVAPAGADVAKLSVATDYAFSSTYTTFGGKTAGTTSVVKYFVDSTKATISEDGVFNAKEAGKYKITAVAFQSTNYYTTWKALNDTTSTVNVLATKSVDVTVVNSVTVKQLGATKAELTFASPVTKADVTANLTVSSLVGTTGTKVKQTVKSVSVSTDGKKATVEMYASFAAGTTYVFENKDMAAVQFVGATAKATDVVDMVIATTDANPLTAKTISIQLLNKDGVDLATIDPTLLSRVTLKSSSEKVWLNGTQITMYNIADTTTITAVYHTYTYDTATGAETGAITKTGTITCVAVAANPITNVAAWTVAAANAAPSTFATVNHVLAVGDTNVKLYVNTVLADGTTYLSNANVNQPTAPAGFLFSSSDSSILIVGADGTLYPVADGTANVIVSYSTTGLAANATVVAAIPVTVSPKRVATTMNLTSYGFTLSNSGAGLADSKTVAIEVLDQFGVKIANPTVAVAKLPGPGTAPIADGTYTNTMTFNGAGSTEGAYTFSVTYNGTIVRYVNVTVAAPKTITGATATSAASYKLSVDSAYDLKVSTTVPTVTANIKVIGYAANGVAYNTLNTTSVSGANMEVVLLSPVQAPINEASDAIYAGTYALTSVSGGTTYVKQATGTYTVKLYSVSGGVRTALLDQVTFTVTDTQVAPTVTVKQLVSDANMANLDAAVQNCFTVTAVPGTTIGSAYVLTGDYVGAFATGADVFVKNVRVDETIGTVTLTHVIAVNTKITVK